MNCYQIAIFEKKSPLFSRKNGDFFQNPGKSILLVAKMKDFLLKNSRSPWKRGDIFLIWKKVYLFIKWIYQHYKYCKFINLIS